MVRPRQLPPAGDRLESIIGDLRFALSAEDSAAS
jgi:hypothetical protein